MKKNITNIIFDLDGTIINSGPDLFDALNHVLEQKELNPIKRNILGNLVGGGAEAMIKKGFDFLNYKYSNDEIPELVKTFLRYYFDHCAEKSFLYKDVQESLIKLKILGYKIGLCTNKKQYLTEKILTEYKIDNLFDIILGSSDDFPLKPEPDMLKHCLKTLNSDPSKSLMVGDSMNDIIPAKKLNMSSVFVSYGYGNLDKKTKPTYIINGIKKIFKILGY